MLKRGIFLTETTTAFQSHSKHQCNNAGTSKGRREVSQYLQHILQTTNIFLREDFSIVGGGVLQEGFGSWEVLRAGTGRDDRKQLESNWMPHKMANLLLFIFGPKSLLSGRCG